MKELNQIIDGDYSESRENFTFNYMPDMGKNRGSTILVIRHSEHSIKKAVKEIGLTSVHICRDKDYWTVRDILTQEWVYCPRY